MPLIVITGVPCSGKTRRTVELKKFFEDKQINVRIISESEAIEKSGFDKNAYFADPKKEKSIRADIKSNIQKHLNTQDVLIIDGSNYIKGCRYEIYCISKLYKTPQCTVHCDLPLENAWLWNEKRPLSEQYSREIFDAVIMRYETPNSTNRWDSPLFAVLPEDELELEEIHNALFNVRPPKPNMSTQSLPLSPATHLYDMDRITQEIITEILTAKRMSNENIVELPKYNLTLDISGNVSHLTRLRRQFLSYSKMQQIDPDNIAALFVQYLKKSL